MAYDCSYECWSVRILERLGDRLFHCVFQCEDEHGHDLALEQGVVAHNGTEAQIEREADHPKIQELCDRAPSYDFHNPEAVAKMLALQLEDG